MGQINSQLDIDIALLEEKQKLLDYKGVDEIISSRQKADSLAAAAEKDKTNPRFMSKIPMLDTMLEGFRLGTVNIVSGPTGEGKTAWTQTLTQNFADQGINSVWFSFEVMPQEFFTRFGEQVPLFYLPKDIPENANNVLWLRQRIIEAQAKYNTKVVFIDHLHYLQDMQGLAGKNNASLYIGDIIRKLKRLSVHLEIAIFLIVHVKTDAGNQGEIKKYYTKDDIRDSSFVKQEADTVVMIWRKRRKSNNEIGWEYTDNAILNLDKHRRTGKVGFVKLQHTNHQFYELSGLPEPSGRSENEWSDFA